MKTAVKAAVAAVMACILCTACHHTPEVAWRQRVTRTPDGMTVLDTVRFSDGSTANVNRLHTPQEAVVHDRCGRVSVTARGDSTGVEYHLYDYDSTGRVERIIAYREETAAGVPEAEELRTLMTHRKRGMYTDNRYEVYTHHYDNRGNLTAVTTRCKGDVTAARYHKLEAVMKTSDKGRGYMEITQRAEDPGETYYRLKRYDDFMLRYEAVYEDSVCCRVTVYRRAPSLPCGVVPAVTCTLGYRNGYNVYTKTDLRERTREVSWWKDGYRHKDERYSMYGSLLSRTVYSYGPGRRYVTARKEKIDWHTKRTVPAGVRMMKMQERLYNEEAEMDVERGTRPLVD